VIANAVLRQNVAVSRQNGVVVFKFEQRIVPHAFYENIDVNLI